MLFGPITLENSYDLMNWSAIKTNPSKRQLRGVCKDLDGFLNFYLRREPETILQIRADGRKNCRTRQVGNYCLEFDDVCCCCISVNDCACLFDP